MYRLALGFDAELSQWLQKRIPHFSASPETRCVGVVRGKSLVGVVAYSNFSQPGEIWAGDVEMSCAADSPRWWSREVGRAMFKIPFEQFGCERVTARVRKKDKRTRRFVEGIGFKLEGIMRRALKNDDICVYGFLRRDWENSVYG